MTKTLDEWTSSVVARCQRFAGELVVTEPQDARDGVNALASSLGTPPSRAHNLIMAPLLLETAFRISDQLHRGLSSACVCRQISAGTIRSFLNWREYNATQVFARWADEFFEQYERHHPTTPASRVARLIRAEPDRAWTIATLAKAASVSTRGLARAFRREYGSSVRTYIHLCRIDAVLERVSPDVKIEAIALEVGYRSRKDFYRVLRQLLQTTPALLRRLSPAERITQRRRLRARLFERAV
jgi:AraC-like DNA-binding protein